MSWLAKTSDIAKSTWNTVRALGPYLISQSDAASEAYARHLARLGAVEAGKLLMLQEAEMLAEIKKDLLQRYFAAPASERIGIRRDLDELEAASRQLRVATRALSYSEEAPKETRALGPASEPGPTDTREGPAVEAPVQEASPHWLDRFRDLTRVANEPWREDLLARALAAESARPGSVSIRALWLLGTLGERQFVAFSELLNLCTEVSGLVIPSPGDLALRPIPGNRLAPEVSLGHLVFLLGDTGLLAESHGSSKNFQAGGRVLAVYGRRRVVVGPLTQKLTVKGILLTELGESVASFCSREINPIGAAIFDNWLKSLDAGAFPRADVG